MSDFLGMADDDLPEYSEVARLAAQKEEEAASAAPTQEQLEEEQQQEEQQEQEQEQVTEEVVETANEETASEEEEKNDTQTEVQEEVNPLAKPDDEVQKPSKEEPVKPTAPEKKDKAEEKTDAPTVSDFEAKILAPFKANGRDMQVRNADEAIRLMQMGANYNMKMAGLKPSLSMMRQLDEAGLLNPESIAQAIDLIKHKNPAAIASLAKAANVDPLEVSEEDVKKYAPQPQVEDERKVVLNETLDSIQNSPNYSRVIRTIKDADESTRELIVQHPQIITAFEAHMASGVYDVIDAEINRRKALGSLPASTPFLHAYKAIGDELQEKGAFNDLQKAKATTASTEPPAVPVKRNVKPAPVTKDAAVSEQRRAAAPSKSSTSVAKTASDFNPLALPDDEFEKVAKQFGYN